LEFGPKLGNAMLWGRRGVVGELDRLEERDNEVKNKSQAGKTKVGP